MNLSLVNKYAIICGSSQGIGLAAAKVLAGLGASCILLARNEDALAKALGELPVSAGQHHRYAVADFSDTGTVSAAIGEIVKQTRIEILVNNSGGPKPGPITRAEAADFEGAFSQHLICNHLLSQAVLPGMRAAGYGRIINIISTSIRTPLPNLGVSNTIRAAVASWAKTLANEVGENNITVNNVLPGLTRTARYAGLLAHMAQSGQLSREEAEAELIGSVPAGRIGTPEEIANVIAFLASPAAAYVTGTSIPVDGGRTPAI